MTCLFFLRENVKMEFSNHSIQHNNIVFDFMCIMSYVQNHVDRIHKHEHEIPNCAYTTV